MGDITAGLVQLKSALRTASPRGYPLCHHPYCSRMATATKPARPGGSCKRVLANCFRGDPIREPDRLERDHCPATAIGVISLGSLVIGGSVFCRPHGATITFETSGHRLDGRRSDGLSALLFITGRPLEGNEREANFLTLLGWSHCWRGETLTLGRGERSRGAIRQEVSRLRQHGLLGEARKYQCRDIAGPSPPRPHSSATHLDETRCCVVATANRIRHCATERDAHMDRRRRRARNAAPACRRAPIPTIQDAIPCRHCVVGGCRAQRMHRGRARPAVAIRPEFRIPTAPPPASTVQPSPIQPRPRGPGRSADANYPLSRLRPGPLQAGIAVAASCRTDSRDWPCGRRKPAANKSRSGGRSADRSTTRSRTTRLQVSRRVRLRGRAGDQNRLPGPHRGHAQVLSRTRSGPISNIAAYRRRPRWRRVS